MYSLRDLAHGLLSHAGGVWVSEWVLSGRSGSAHPRANSTQSHCKFCVVYVHVLGCAHTGQRWLALEKNNHQLGLAYNYCIMCWIEIENWNSHHFQDILMKGLSFKWPTTSLNLNHKYILIMHDSFSIAGCHNVPTTRYGYWLAGFGEEVSQYLMIITHTIY